MTGEESVEQLKSLIEAWQLNEADLNQTDIEAIKTILKENKQLKMINKKYERLNKENGRGFKITNVQEYNIYELLSYKNYKENWNKLKDHFEFLKINSTGGNKEFMENIILLMQALEQMSDNNEPFVLDDEEEKDYYIKDEELCYMNLGGRK